MAASSVITGKNNERKDFAPEKSSQVADWRQVNGVNRGVVINRQKMQMPRITYDDASTHGKFMHGAMVREWDFKFARFMDPALTTDWVRLL